MANKNVLSANKTESKKRATGVATVKAGEAKVRVTFRNEDTWFDNGKNSKTFAYDDLPKTPKISPNSEEEYFVVLSPDKDEIQSFGPVEGVFTAKCVDLSRPNADEDPAPYEVTPKNEKWEAYLAFNAYFEIQSGSFKKLQIPYFLHYKFEESKTDEGMTAWKGDPENRKATRLHQLIEFCEKLNLVAEPIEWPEDGNILPVLLDRILENNKIVKIVVKNGYIESLMSAHKDEDEDESENEDNESQRKAVSRKLSRRDDEDDEDL